LLYAIPGGLIGVCLPIDPSITRNNKMIGNLLGAKGTLPDIFTSINVKFYLMKNLLGASK
jgi:translation initiation factor 2 subunit 3